MMKKLMYFLLLNLALLSACSTSRFIEPLEDKQLAINAAAGGPIIGFGGLVIPIPFSSLTAGYGFCDQTTGYASLHTTSLLYKTIQLEIGARQQLYTPTNKYVPNLSGALALNGLANFRSKDIRLFPEVNISPYWKYGQWTSYLNVQSWVDLYKIGEENNRWDDYLVPGFAIGQIFTNKSKSWSIALEYKRLAPTLNEDYSVVDYKTLSNKGANGIYFSFTKFINHDKSE